jgi:hypothetical protein
LPSSYINNKKKTKKTKKQQNILYLETDAFQTNPFDALSETFLFSGLSR